MKPPLAGKALAAWSERLEANFGRHLASVSAQALQACGGPGSGVPGPCPGGGKVKEPAAPKTPAGKKADPVGKATAKVEKAKAAVQKAKDGLLKAKKELADLKAKQRAESPRAKAAAEKAKNAKPVNVGKHVADTKALSDAAAARVDNKGPGPKSSAKMPEAEFKGKLDAHMKGLEKGLNKAQAIEVAKGLGIVAKTKGDALRNIRDRIERRRGAGQRVGLVDRIVPADEGG